MSQLRYHVQLELVVVVVVVLLLLLLLLVLATVAEFELPAVVLLASVETTFDFSFISSSCNSSLVGVNIVVKRSKINLQMLFL